MKSLLSLVLPACGTLLALVLAACSSGRAADTVATTSTAPIMNTKLKKATFAAG